MASPKYPDLRVLWKLIETEEINYFGTSAPFLMACQKEKLRPRNEFRLQSLRSIGSTGAPLPDDAFRWVYDQVKPSVWLGSAAAGRTFVPPLFFPIPGFRCTQAVAVPGLGAPIESWDERGIPVWNQVGELCLPPRCPACPSVSGMIPTGPDTAKPTSSIFLGSGATETGLRSMPAPGNV